MLLYSRKQLIRVSVIKVAGDSHCRIVYSIQLSLSGNNNFILCHVLCIVSLSLNFSCWFMYHAPCSNLYSQLFLFRQARTCGNTKYSTPVSFLGIPLPTTNYQSPFIHHHHVVRPSDINIQSHRNRTYHVIPFSIFQPLLHILYLLVDLKRQK